MAQISYKDAIKQLRLNEYEIILESEKIFQLGAEEYWKIITAGAPEEAFEDQFTEQWENLSRSIYRNKLTNITTMSEYWEQDLFRFLKEKGLTTASENEFGIIRRDFENAFPAHTLDKYPAIIDMRTFVNAVKHGPGRSLTDLISKSSGDILADSIFGVENDDGTVTKRKQIEFNENTLISETLNPDGKLQEYYDEIIRFWNDIFNEYERREADLSASSSEKTTE